MKSFVLGGIEVPVDSSLAFEQVYGLKAAVDPSDPEDQADVTLGSCNTVRQACAGDGGINAKLTTTISVSASWFPALFAGLNFSRPIMVECWAPRMVGSTGRVIDITYKRRDGALYVPTGYALVDGEMVPTYAVASDTNEYTLTAVTGATAYFCQYYPKFNMLAVPEERYQSTNLYTWTLQGEEI